MQRSHRLRLCLLPLALMLLCSAAWGQTSTRQAQWIPLGPEGGDARSLAYDPHDASRIFLGTSAGELYLSTDGGANWAHFAHLGNGNDYVLDHIVVDPADSNTIYVAGWSIENDGGDLFRSRDGGRTWQALAGMHGKSIRSFALARSNPRVMVTGALDGVFRSDDAGDTWRQISPAHHAEIKNIESVAVDPRTPDVVYAGTWHLPWKTDDGGRTWHSIKQGVIDDSDVFSIIINPANPSQVYMSACSGIYKSDVAGELFHKVQGIPFSARRTRMLHQDPSNPDVVYAGTTEGLWKTLDGGKSWRRVTAPNLIVNDIFVDPRRPARVLLATDRSGVLASNDGGQTVFASNHGFSHRQVSAVLADAADPATIYAGVVNDKEFGGVFVSHDAGAHWTQMNAGLAGHDIFSLAQAENGDLLAGTNRGVFVLERKLARWRPMNLVVEEKVSTVTTRVPHSSKKRTITRRQSIKSELRGRVMQLAVAGPAWFAAASTGLFLSLNEGQSWQQAEVAGKENFVAVDARNDLAAAATPNAVLISTDGGSSWRSAAVPRFVTAIYSVAVAPGAVWLSTREGAFRSTDNGASWDHILAGTPAQNLFSIRYDSHRRRLVGISAAGEVFAAYDGGQSWSPTADSGWKIRRLTVAGGRLMGITPFSGIVAQPEAEALSPRAPVPAGSSQ